MSQHSHSRRPSSETLVLPAMRSTSPLPLPLPLIKPAGKSMHESIALPPIQSLTREFPSRREQQQQQVFQRDSPPDQHTSPYQRKRAGIPGDDHASPPGTNKRRRVESEETNGTFNEQPLQPGQLGQPGPAIPESNPILRRHGKQPSVHEEPSTPTHVHVHVHARHASSGSNIAAHGTSHDPPTKQEQVSPPAVIVQSPSTGSSTTAWQNEPSQSFSRRISNPSSHRSTPRKGPPSRLNFQTHSSQRASLDNIAPSIRSAPPVPVHLPSNQPPPPLAPTSTWLTNRPSAQQPRPRHTSHLSSSDLPTPRALARDAWPAIPTPTSLRLGARAIVPPTTAANQVSASTMAASTPPVPSPIPILGSGTGLADKGKFMQKMSEIYDRAASNSHSKKCVTMDEVDRRIRDVVILRDHEILQLKKEVVELQKYLRRRTGPSGSMDEDGDVNMQSSNSNPTRTAQPVASSGDTSNIPRLSPNPIDSTKEGTLPSEQFAGTRLPSPPVNGITSHSPAA